MQMNIQLGLHLKKINLNRQKCVWVCLCVCAQFSLLQSNSLCTSNSFYSTSRNLQRLLLGTKNRRMWCSQFPVYYKKPVLFFYLLVFFLWTWRNFLRWFYAGFCQNTAVNVNDKRESPLAWKYNVMKSGDFQQVFIDFKISQAPYFSS